MIRARQCAAGFTLTELVVVIGIVTILSAFAISRINTKSFDTEGFANRAAAMVRYAQKIAVSQRRDVFVVISSNTVSLCYVITNCGTPTSTSPVHEPPGTGAFSFAAPSGVTASAILFPSLAPITSFSFSALGKPSQTESVKVNIVGDVTRTITVEAETGYVH